MEFLGSLLNTVLLVFIVATMFAAGLRTSLAALVGVLRNAGLVALVLLANLVVIPLLGLAVAAVVSLSTAGVIAVLLLAASPGAPFGAKMVMIQKGDLVTGSVLQVLLAAVGSITFPVTANLLLGVADVGDVSLPVGRLIAAVGVLQLVPFTLGLAVRAWAPGTGAEWLPQATRTSNVSFLALLALGVLGSWQQILDLLGSLVLLAGALFAVGALAFGFLLTAGHRETRTTAALLAPSRNAGPVFTAVPIAFGGDPAVLAAVTGILLVGLVVELPVASWLGSRREPAPATETGGRKAAAFPDATGDRGGS